MEQTLAVPERPRLRAAVAVTMGSDAVELAIGERRCSFAFPEEGWSDVARLVSDLKEGGRAVEELAARASAIADHVPGLLAEFDRLRLLVTSDPPPLEGARTGSQLYREVRRVADRTAERAARSSFLRALRDETATREQLIGYALEYYWIVKEAPGLIGPALASAHGPEERALLQTFLKSELGHDAFLGKALGRVGIPPRERELHQPLPATFALGASLGVYARQHPLSFKACLFLFERAQPAFIDAFDARCRTLALPKGFHAPLRAHADLNEEHDHADISRALLSLEGAIAEEACTIVKSHVALMVETMVQQEEQILDYYGRAGPRIARICD